MTTTARAIQELFVRNMHHGRELEEFTVEPGEEFLLLTGNGYHTVVEPSQFSADTSLVEYGFGKGSRPEAVDRLGRWEDHMAAGRDINTSVYGKLYEIKSI